MKKKNWLLAIALVIALNGAWGQNSQWDVYNVIPYYKSISFVFDSPDAWDGYSFYSMSQGLSKYDSGKKLSFTIYDDYTVTLDYSSTMLLFRDEYRWSNIPIRINGTGIVRWQNDKMVIDMNVKTSTSGGSDHGSKYEGTRNGDVYSTEDYSFSSYSNTKTYTYILEYAEGQGFRLVGNDIMSTITGNDHIWADNGVSRDVPIYYQICLKLTQRYFYFNAVEKSQSELNAQSSDMYGKWQWNDDRSVIYLESTTKDATLVIWNHKKEIEKARNRLLEYEMDTMVDVATKQALINECSDIIQRYQENPIVWGLDLHGGTGYKSEKADTGDDLTHLMITFDGGAEQSFSFAKSYVMGVNGAFEHVQYDRFMGTLKRNASILSQIKDKRVMIVNYILNGSTKTAMFQLEGLEAIYNAITQ